MDIFRYTVATGVDDIGPYSAVVLPVSHWHRIMQSIQSATLPIGTNYVTVGGNQFPDGSEK